AKHSGGRRWAYRTATTARTLGSARLAGAGAAAATAGVVGQRRHQLLVVVMAGRFVLAGLADQHRDPVAEEADGADNGEGDAQQAARDQIRRLLLDHGRMGGADPPQHDQGQARCHHRAGDDQQEVGVAQDRPPLSAGEALGPFGEPLLALLDGRASGQDGQPLVALTHFSPIGHASPSSTARTVLAIRARRSPSSGWASSTSSASTPMPALSDWPVDWVRPTAAGDAASVGAPELEAPPTSGASELGLSSSAAGDESPPMPEPVSGAVAPAASTDGSGPPDVACNDTTPRPTSREAMWSASSTLTMSSGPGAPGMGLCSGDSNPTSVLSAGSVCSEASKSMRNPSEPNWPVSVPVTLAGPSNVT